MVDDCMASPEFSLINQIPQEDDKCSMVAFPQIHNNFHRQVSQWVTKIQKTSYSLHMLPT